MNDHIVLKDFSSLSAREQAEQRKARRIGQAEIGMGGDLADTDIFLTPALVEVDGALEQVAKEETAEAQAL